MKRITAALLDKVLDESFTDTAYGGATRATAKEIAEAVNHSDQVAIALVHVLQRELPAEAELCTVLTMGINIGLVLAERLRAEERANSVQ